MICIGILNGAADDVGSRRSNIETKFISILVAKVHSVQVQEVLYAVDITSLESEFLFGDLGRQLTLSLTYHRLGLVSVLNFLELPLQLLSQ